jgi:hypothetical protein
MLSITVQLGRDPTTSELDALQSLRNTIAAIETAINALASNAGWSSPNGAHTTASELKFIWSKIDFVVNLETGFDNGSGLGQADYNYGDPIVTFNINTLVSYSTGSDTMNFLVAHELGHLSMAGDPNGNPFYTDQRTANDVARALLHGAGLPYWDNPGFGYTDGAPLQFSVL